MSLNGGSPTSVFLTPTPLFLCADGRDAGTNHRPSQQEIRVKNSRPAHLFIMDAGEKEGVVRPHPGHWA
jgi:hypothetical protein